MKFFACSLICASFALGWTISGQVVSAQGNGISDVSISSFNYAGAETISDADGNFTLAYDLDGVNTKRDSPTVLHCDGKTLILQNVRSPIFKVSLMDALGKVLLQKKFQNASGQVSLNLENLPQKAKFLRLAEDNSVQTYYLGQRNVLKKVEEAKASFFFRKDGFEDAYYQMSAENETGVVVTMFAKGSVSSSSIAWIPAESSSSEAPSSSSSGPVDCTGKQLLPGNTTYTIGNREYILHVPNSYTGTTPVPLLVDYHPIGGSASQWASSKTYEAATESDQVIIIYPNGDASAGGFMGNAWNVGPCCTDADDIAFSREFIKAVQEKACIDPKRIYATGFSMGGGMSNYAACKMADVYAAVAPAAFDLSKEVVDNNACSPSRPISVLNFRGTNDNVVSYEGAYSSLVPRKPITFLGAVKNLEKWAELNGCSGSPEQDSPSSGCQTYTRCNAGVQVGLCTKQGGGHEAGDPVVGWAFLKQFSLP